MSADHCLFFTTQKRNSFLPNELMATFLRTQTKSKGDYIREVVFNIT